MEKEKKKTNKKSWVLVTVLIVILLIAAGWGGFLAGASYVSEKSMEKKREVKEEKGLEMSIAVQEKLEKFVLTGLRYGVVNSTYEHFAKGTTELPKKIKLQMAYNATEKGRQTVLTEEESNELIGEKPGANEEVEIMGKKDFDNSYKLLFNEEINSKLDDVDGLGCPAILAENKEETLYYLFSRCGGIGSSTITSTVKSYDSDAEHYYVHSESLWEDLSVSQEPSKTTKLLWTFDKDFHFVSTEVEK